MNYIKELMIAKYRRCKLFLQVDLPYNVKKFISRLSRKVEDNLTAFMKNHPEIYPAGQPFATVGESTFGGGLYLKHTRYADGRTIDYGLVSRAKVTAEFVNEMVDQLVTEASTWGDWKYHISGTDATAEANTHTSLLGATGTVRIVGTQTEGASANIYRSVATITYTSTHAVTEHGLFNAAYSASQADGVLMDRSTFGAVNVVSGDTCAFTYELTCTAEA